MMRSVTYKLFQYIEEERAARGDDPIRAIALDKLVPFMPYPFKLYEGESLAKLVNSIRDDGLLKPIVVRYIKYKDGYFEILSGHNRVNAARLLGHDMINAIVRDDLDSDIFANHFFIESNRHHRSFAERTTYVTANDKIREIHRLHEILFKITLKNDMPEIIDYSLLTRKISWPENSTVFKLSKEENKRETITSIRELRTILEELVLSVRHLRYENLLHIIQPEDTGLTVNQLVLDILYIKYIGASEMTLNEYCAKHLYFDFDYNGNWIKLADLERENYQQDKEVADAVYQKLKRNKENFVKELIKPKVKSSLKKLCNHNEYVEYIEKNRRKTKAIWDFLWYQYNLTLVKSIVRTSYIDSEEEQKKFLNVLINYEKFVQSAFSPKYGDNEDYFHKSMGFYHLESISMLESMYKYAEKTELEEINMDSFDFMTEVWSVEEVSLPYIKKQDGTSRLRFKKKDNFYRTPLSNSDYELIVRAQAFELFTYYYEFKLDDYDEISEFIKQDYNILENYYEKNKIWKDIKANQPLTREQKTHIKKMLKIINTSFGGIRKMNVEFMNSLYNDDTKDREEQENKDYENIFGMDKVTFEKNLSLLKRDTKKLRHKGGKKSQLSDLEQLLIAIECKQSHRSMDDIAKKYGVSKSTISEVNTRVSEILKKE